MLKSPVRKNFDKHFYDRYYANPSTRVASLDEVYRVAKFVLSYLDHLDVPVASALDAGCGVGLWQKTLWRLDRNIRYTGLDPSEYLCDQFGWTCSSIADFKSRRKYDLVVCQDVLQYVDDKEVYRSFDTIARLCRGALYLDVPTKEDVEGGALDMRKTDERIHVRSVRWYRRIVDRHFTSVGGGVFIPAGSPAVLLALEKG